MNAARFALTVNEGRLAKGVPIVGAGAVPAPATTSAGIAAGTGTGTGIGTGTGTGGLVVTQSKYIRSSEFKQPDLPYGYQHLTMY